MPSILLSVAEWTLDTVMRVVAEHPHEPDWLDYKEALVPHRELPSEKKDEHKDSIRRCACAMANTNGGLILFGVSDKREEPEERLVGVDLREDLRKQFGDLLEKIDPNIRDFYAKPIPFDEGDKGVWVVQIPVSPLRPHMLDGRFYKRVAGGKCEAMSAREVRDQIIFREGLLSRMALLRLMLRETRNILDHIPPDARTLRGIVDRFDTSSLRLLIAETAHLYSTGLLGALLEVCRIGDRLNRRCDWSKQSSMFLADGRTDSKAVYADTLEMRSKLGECESGLAGLATRIGEDKPQV